MDPIIAITRYNEVVCKNCISDSFENAVFLEADDSEKLMNKFNIGVIRVSDLKLGTKVCGRCKNVIKAD
jgi:hypothetical protein